MIKFIKSTAVTLLTAVDLIAFLAGIFYWYGGPDGAAFSKSALTSTVFGTGLSVIAATAALALSRFDKKLLLASLILHELALILWFIPMSAAAISSKGFPQIYHQITPEPKSKSVTTIQRDNSLQLSCQLLCKL